MSAAAVAASSPPLSPSQMQSDESKLGEGERDDGADKQEEDLQPETPEENQNSENQKEAKMATKEGSVESHEENTSDVRRDRTTDFRASQVEEKAEEQEPLIEAKVFSNLPESNENHDAQVENLTVQDAQSLAGETIATVEVGPAQYDLPPAVRTILEEVARSGEFSSLPWTRTGTSGLTEPKSQPHYEGKERISAEEEGRKLASIPPTADDAVSHALPKDSVTKATSSLDPPSIKSNRKSIFSASGRPESPYLAFSRKMNGVRNSKKRRSFSESAVVAAGKRKRPFHSIRSGSGTASSSINGTSSLSPRASESELEEAFQYGYESESTLTSINSDASADRRDHLPRKNQRTTKASHAGVKLASSASKFDATESSTVPPLQYHSLREVFCAALIIVLDRSYSENGGYKLSPAEKRRNEILMKSRMAEQNQNGPGRSGNKPYSHIITSEDTFRQRRQRLIGMLTRPSPLPSNSRNLSSDDSGPDPPFTIQRLAEVLIAPRRFYKQTHKLCNCLEKLLLVSSPSNAFGGINGGQMSRQEVEEKIALAQELDRQELMQQQRLMQRQSMAASNPHHMERRPSPGSPDVQNDRIERDRGGGSPVSSSGSEGSAGLIEKMGNLSAGEESSEANARASLQAAARASLRSKFDHVGIDPHSATITKQDAQSAAEEPRRPSSPPPPSPVNPSLSPTSQKNMLSPGRLNQHELDDDTQRQDIDRINESGVFQNHPHSHPPSSDSSEVHMLQRLHQVAALASSQMRASSEDMNMIFQHHRPHSFAKDSSEDGRSDVDSESDDLSLDDSASDRSDGSDSVEPFPAARAMALNRIHQQQQRLQSLNFATPESFRPPPDAEYQSGDSIDSMRAEDSYGSDSSSSANE